MLRRLTKGTVLGRLDGVVVQYGRCRFLVTEMEALAFDMTWYMLLALGGLKIALLKALQLHAKKRQQAVQVSLFLRGVCTLGRCLSGRRAVVLDDNVMG